MISQLHRLLRNKRFISTQFLVVTLILLALAVFPYRTAILAWRVVRLPQPALFLTDDPRLAEEIGDYYFNGGAYNLKMAERAYLKAQELDPEMAWPRYQRSRIEFLQGNFYEALLAVNEELALHPDFKRAYYMRGLIHGYAGNLPAAAADFLEFLKWEERGWAAHNDLAWIYFRQGNFSEAEAIARRGLYWHPKNAWLLTALGAVLLKKEERAEAKTVLLKALEEAERLLPEDWGRAYPGNNPTSYKRGLEEMKNVIRGNLKIADEQF